MAQDACMTGVGVSLTTPDTSLKFGSTEDYKVKRISGLGRSVIVIDDSHLGLPKNGPMRYCFGDLVELRPLTVECLQDPDNTTRFEAVGTGATNAAISTTEMIEAMRQPLPLGDVTAVATPFILTFPSEKATAAVLYFTGAFIDDGGVDIAQGDRLRNTFQIQPDGNQFVWTAAAA